MNLPSSLARLSGHLPRVLTGLALLALLVAALTFRGFFLYILLVIVTLAALWEFFQMFWPGWSKLPSKILGMLCGCGVLYAAQPAYPGSPNVLGSLLAWTPSDRVRLIMLFAAFAASSLAFLADYGRGNDKARLEDCTVLPLGVLYLPCAMSLALDLRAPEQVMVIAAAVASDTFAYYAGCMWGKHKIWPRVSPKKSWEGSIGGLVGCTLVTVTVAACAFRFARPGGDPHLGRILCWVGMGIFLNIAAQAGDFFESALKRTRGVKDSGALLPGHGGVLDRIDSLLFVLPAYCLVRMILDNLLPFSLVP